MAERRYRCAIYTRKSTEDGLEQEFNSLDAQYEACAAYAMSQRHEGWEVVAERYDDGGFSGGTLQRPGLARLLADVAAGKVDIILLYKIDRLTRSLTDFAKIVEVLDNAKASFVSITQSFNTTTSMGRLTLNMLLSFAQFEREVTGERIRDKIAASKRKGMWMGGTLPLGYDVRERRLLVNEAEAELVRHIMQRYLALGSVPALVEELEREGYRTKVQHGTSGPHRGGCAFRRGTLYHLLANPIYRGMIVHKGESFPGEHEPIVSETLWSEVQTALADRAQGHSRRIRVRQPSLLAGLVVDGEGRAMAPSHATKPGKRYRYYCTRLDLLDGSPAWRVPAHDLEQLVCDRLAAMLVDSHGLYALDGAPTHDAHALKAMLEAGDVTAAILRSGGMAARLPLLQALVTKVSLREDAIAIAVDHAGLLTQLGVPHTGINAEPIVLTCPAMKMRRGHQLRLVIPAASQDAAPPAARDEKLVALIAEAHAARVLVMANADSSIAALAADAKRCRARLTQLLAISCLDPAIVVAIVEGRQPAGLTHRSLLTADLPLAWDAQRALLGLS